MNESNTPLIFTRWFVDPAAVGGMAEEAGAGDVVWLEEAEEEEEAALEPMGMREMVESLVQRTMNLAELGGAGVETLVTLARRGRNYRLRAPDPGAAWERLRVHLGLPSEGPGGAVR